MGIALHPQFASNHFVYLLYTANTAGGPVNRLARYRESNNTLADRAVLLDRMAGANVHDGGRIRFGPDGQLYIAMGDAANTSLSQSLSSLNGKILRVDQNGLPAVGNPFGSEIGPGAIATRKDWTGIRRPARSGRPSTATAATMRSTGSRSGATTAGP